MSEPLHSRKKAAKSEPSTEYVRPQIAQARSQQTPSSFTDIDNHVMRSYKHEATTLEIQAKYGTITPQGQERLTVVQAKMADYWQQKLAKANLGQQLPIQCKLTIGAPGDQYEQEADRVAAQVVNQIHAPTAPESAQTQTVQREDMLEDEDLQMKPMIQLQTGNDAIAAPLDLETTINQARGGGQPLDESLRASIGQAMGADFSGVNVHTDAQADQLNRSVQARAFTTGQDVFFRQGEYNPGSRGGKS